MPARLNPNETKGRFSEKTTHLRSLISNSARYSADATRMGEKREKKGRERIEKVIGKRIKLIEY